MLSQVSGMSEHGPRRHTMERGRKQREEQMEALAHAVWSHLQAQSAGPGAVVRRVARSTAELVTKR